MNLWHGLGSGDMLEVTRMGLHVAQPDTGHSPAHLAKKKNVVLLLFWV